MLEKITLNFQPLNIMSNLSLIAMALMALVSPRTTPKITKPTYSVTSASIKKQKRFFSPTNAFKAYYTPAMLFPKPLPTVLPYLTYTKFKQGNQYMRYPYISLGIILGGITFIGKVKADPPPYEFYDEDELFIAITNSDKKTLIELFAKRNIQINEHFAPNGLRLLHIAVLYSNEDIVSFLLEKNANVDQVDDYGWTALHYASHNDAIAIAKSLLKYGASEKKKSNWGIFWYNFKTPYDLAKTGEMRKLLKKA